MSEMFGVLSPALLMIAITVITQMLKKSQELDDDAARKWSLVVSYVLLGSYHLLVEATSKLPELIAMGESPEFILQLVLFVSWTLFGALVYPLFGWFAATGIYNVGNAQGWIASSEQLAQRKETRNSEKGQVGVVLLVIAVIILVILLILWFGWLKPDPPVVTTVVPTYTATAMLLPTATSTMKPTEKPTLVPTDEPTVTPEPTKKPTPTVKPTKVPIPTETVGDRHCCGYLDKEWSCRKTTTGCVGARWR